MEFSLDAHLSFQSSFCSHHSDMDHVYVGITTTRPQTGTRYEVTQSIRHPDYPQELQVDFDVMIVHLSEPVPASVAEPIELNWDDDLPMETGFQLAIMGFGSTLGGPGSEGILEVPTTLQIAPTQYVSFEECAVAEDPESGQKYGNSPQAT